MHRQLEAAEELLQATELGEQRIGRRRARGLVPLVAAVPEGLLGRIDGERETRRVLLADDLQEERREAVERGRRFAARRVHRRQRVVRAKEDRKRVEDDGGPQRPTI
jgi:hypothetical protein